MKKKSRLIVVVVLIVIVVIAMIIAPGIAKNYAVKNSRQLLGRQIALEKIKVNYFTGTARFYDFKMFEADDSTTFVSFDTLIINLVPYKFITNELVIQQLYLKGLRTNIIQEDTVFNFDDLVAFYNTGQDTTAVDTLQQGEPFRFELSDFELKEADISYHDLSIGKIWDLNDINFYVPYISWDQEESSEAGLRFNFKNEGFFESSIKVDPIGGDFDANIQISKLHLSNFNDYAAKYIDIKDLDGKFNTNINILGNINQPENTLVVGLVNFEDFVASDLSDREFITIENLDCHLGKIDAAKMDFIIDSVLITNPYLYFDLNDSTNNIFDIIHYNEMFADDTLAETRTAEDEDSLVNLMYAVNKLKIENGKVEFMERYTGNLYPYYIEKLNVTAANISSESKTIKEGMEAKIHLVLNESTPVYSTLNAEINGGDFSANLEIENLDLAGFSGYARDYLNIDKFSGAAVADINFKGNLYDYDKVIVDGFAGAHKFKVTDQKGKEFITLNVLRSYFSEIDSYNMRFMFDSIFMEQPYIYFDIHDSTNNIFEVINYEYDYSQDTLAEISPSTVAEEEFELAYAIDHISINDGIIDFVDNTTTEPFKYLLSEVEFSADSITTETVWIDTYANMLLNKRGKLTAQFSFNPANPMDFELDYVITDFLLSDLNIYSRYYMGFPILYGDMYYKSQTSILNNQLKSENKLVIANVELGNKQGGLYSLPIKFALFLLKDRDGVINLDVPVRGDLHDPKVNIGKIVWNTFKNLIIKVAASPVDFLSGFLQVDPKDISQIEFTYLDTTMTDYRQKQLDLLLELEQKKEGLEIELVYFNDIEKEKEQIAISQAGKMFEEQTNDSYAEDEDSFIAFLKDQTKSDSLSIAEASKLIVTTATLDSITELLVQKRMDLINGYLKTQNDSTKIKTFIPNADSPQNVGSKPLFDVKYSIK